LTNRLFTANNFTSGNVHAETGEYCLPQLFSRSVGGGLSAGFGLLPESELSVIPGEAVLGLVVGLAAGAVIYLWRTRRREADERKKAQERAAQLASVVEFSDAAVIDVTREGNIENWNAGAEKFFGYSGEEAVGQPSSLLFPRGGPAGMPLIIDAIEKGEPLDNHEAVCLRKDGKLMDVSLTVFPAKGDPGSGSGASVLARELTERKAEEALRKRNAELSALFDISSALNETITIDTVLPRVLEAITNLGILYIERKGALFVVEGDRMRLFCHMGVTNDFVHLHRDMKVGDCLCGLAAKTGEVIVSKNSLKDDRHSMNRRSIMYRDMTPHGHVIIPLKAKDRVAGVLCLYLTVDVDVDDSLIKLLLSIGSQIALAIDNARLYEETRALSLHDPLTGLANRRLMEISLDNNFASAKRYERPFSAIMLDLDRFKNYNDTHGHVAGDRLLVDVAKIISREVRETDLAVRYGGEEFIVLLPETRLARAWEVAERIREKVVEHGRITVSLGVSTYQREMENREDIIAMADDALYQAKQRGRNQTIALKQAKE
jgi:diguanylate cyclase (GGDEF)-like protein/PAS domain S-box-containing protein